MGARSVTYAFTPLAVVMWAVGAIVAAVVLLGGSANEQALVREEQDFYAVSFINPSSMCEPEDERAWVLVTIEAYGRPQSVDWTLYSDADPTDVRGRPAVVEPGTPKRIARALRIRPDGVSVIRFATSDGEHDLVTRCTPDDPL